MSMDRKNKKAAQAAANAANPAASVKDGHRQGRSQRSMAQGQQPAVANSRNPLLPGSTAPTRSHSSSRPPIPMPLKATLSPSTPAPPVHAADFASYGLPDESNKLPSAPAQGKIATNPQSMADICPSSPSPHAEHNNADSLEISAAQPRLSSADIPTIRRTIAAHTRGPDSPDFGPIGSPPRSVSIVHPPQSADVSAGSSPHVTLLSTSPFSAPGSRPSFLVAEQKEPIDFRSRSGLSASLGAMMSWTSNLGQDHTLRDPTYASRDGVAVEDGDLEEFIPGSLSELLTPEEKSRRFSRTNVSRPSKATDREGFHIQSSSDGGHHRHSRSVPATSLLQEIRSIWTENSSGTLIEPGGSSLTSGGLGNGTPSSFQSTAGFDALAPSNASAAFLPGLHHLISTQSTRSDITANGSSLYAQSSATASTHHTTTLVDRNGLTQPPSRSGMFPTGVTYDGAADPFFSQNQRYSSVRSAMGDDSEDRRNAVSPSTRALQAHAPGQSLPQGLAAGYSRIHALPPPPSLASPSTPGTFSPGRPTTMSSKGLNHMPNIAADWLGSSPPAGIAADATGMNATNGATAGFDSMFSRLSYSAAASRTHVSVKRPIDVTELFLLGSSAAPPGPRSTGGRIWHNGQGPLSPLNGPVLTGDDDDLFSMDG